MILSCNKYKNRQKLLKKVYDKNINSDELYLFIEGDENIKECYHIGDTIKVKCSDHYEKLPLKVVLGIQYITRNFEFDKIIKVDDDILINFKKYYKHLESLDNSNLYFGQQTPPCAIVPGNTWHMGKCSKECEWNNKPLPDYMFPENRTKILYYPAGGIYVLSYDVCSVILNFNDKDMKNSTDFVYEDLNLYMRLNEHNISPSDLKKYYLLFRLPNEILKCLDNGNFNQKIFNEKNFIEDFKKNKLDNLMAYHTGSMSNYKVSNEAFENIINIFDKVISI